MYGAGGRDSVTDLDDDGWGLGIWTPGTLPYTGGFFGTPGAGGPEGAPTGDMSPLHCEVLDAKLHCSYDYVLLLGTLEASCEHWHYLGCRNARSPFPSGRMIATVVTRLT